MMQYMSSIAGVAILSILITRLLIPISHYAVTAHLVHAYKASCLIICLLTEVINTVPRTCSTTVLANETSNLYELLSKD